jgi:hypothetical protein
MEQLQSLWAGLIDGGLRRALRPAALLDGWGFRYPQVGATPPPVEARKIESVDVGTFHDYARPGGFSDHTPVIVSVTVPAP